MHSKKGVIELQFNWIFILVAGALILIFFVVIVQRQEKVSENKRDVDIRGKLSTILTSAKQSTGTMFVIKIPDTEIKFDCSGYSVGGTAPFQLDESFSPSRLKSSQQNLLIWAMDWSLPYKVANLQYITSPDIKYVVIAESQAVNDLKKILPQNITVAMVQHDQVQNLESTNNYMIRFIIITREGLPTYTPVTLTLHPSISRMKDDDVSAIQIMIDEPGTDNELDGHGRVALFRKGGSSFSATPSPVNKPYIKKELLLGAIFSDREETYDCVSKRAFEQYALTSEIYQRRTGALFDLYQDNVDPMNRGPYAGFCDSFVIYSQASDLIDGLNVFLDNILGNKQDIYNTAYGSGIGENLRKMNKDLLRRSCPLIY